MDLYIRREEDCLITKVYRKNTHTFRYLHWRSNHSERTLLGVMKTLIHRAHRLCDREEDLKAELGFLKDIFISNCYPVKKVDQVFGSYKPNLDEKRDEAEVEDHSLSMSVPYIQGFSERFQNIMRNEGIKVVFMKGKTLENELCNLKPLKGRMERKDVVYMVDCKVCGVSYIGETSQRFSDRCGQHQKCIEKKNRKNGFYMHIRKSLGTKHKNRGINAMHWEGVTYLDSETFWKKRKIKESLYINAYDASSEVRGLMNLEKGLKVDACWNEFNEAIRSEAEVVRTKQLKRLGLRTLGPRPRTRRRNRK